MTLPPSAEPSPPGQAAPIPLSTLGVGCRATILELPKVGSAFLRLREMGLLAGTVVTLIRAAPLGDPFEIKLRGYHLTLRKTEAAQILVEPIG